MADFFRAVALDYDGTLTMGARPQVEVLSAISGFRDDRHFTVLVTGRIYRELIADFPEVAQYFDAMVTENGATIWRGGQQRVVGSRVSDKLDHWLRAAGVPFRRGLAILALDARFDNVARTGCIELGLDAQLIRNRDALMIIPAGSSKGAGLLEVLAELGVSHHNTVALGDAENDHTLLTSCEIGVAVANAVPALLESADHVLPRNNGAGVAAFLREQLPTGLATLQPPRRQLPIGTTEDGDQVTIPAFRSHLFIDGPTGSGKSYVAGLIVEALVAADYTICVLDLEGDHGALGDELRSVLTLGGAEPLPTVEEVGRLVRHRFSSVVVNLSLREPAVRCAYARDLLMHLSDIRQEWGLPHWIIVEEAHMVPGEALARTRDSGNLCLVTYHPDWLSPQLVEDNDVLITTQALGCARLRRGLHAQEALSFCPGLRQVAHVRHLHKYADGEVPVEKGFTFRGSHGELGTHVTSLRGFMQALGKTSADSFLHHAAHRDFSRWVRDVFQDRSLSHSMRKIEERSRQDTWQSARGAMRELLALRYGIDEAGLYQDAGYQG